MFFFGLLCFFVFGFVKKMSKHIYEHKPSLPFLAPSHLTPTLREAARNCSAELVVFFLEFEHWAKQCNPSSYFGFIKISLFSEKEKGLSNWETGM